MLKKMKNKLRRKFELYNVAIENQNLVLNFELENFWNFDKNKLLLYIKNEHQYIITEKKSNNYIKVKIDIECLSDKDYTIDFFYKNKKCGLFHRKI